MPLITYYHRPEAKFSEFSQKTHQRETTCVAVKSQIICAWWRSSQRTRLIHKYQARVLVSTESWAMNDLNMRICSGVIQKKTGHNIGPSKSKKKFDFPSLDVLQEAMSGRDYVINT